MEIPTFQCPFQISRLQSLPSFWKLFFPSPKRNRGCLFSASKFLEMSPKTRNSRPYCLTLREHALKYSGRRARFGGSEWWPESMLNQLHHDSPFFFPPHDKSADVFFAACSIYFPVPLPRQLPLLQLPPLQLPPLQPLPRQVTGIPSWIFEDVFDRSISWKRRQCQSGSPTRRLPATVCVYFTKSDFYLCTTALEREDIGFIREGVHAGSCRATWAKYQISNWLSRLVSTLPKVQMCKIVRLQYINCDITDVPCLFEEVTCTCENVSPYFSCDDLKWYVGD